MQFDEVKGYARAMEYVVDTIRSHMDEVNSLEKKPVWDMDIIHHESYDLGRNVGWNECLETIQMNKNNSWIPVEERLPESDGFYLATLDGEICGQEEAFTGLAEFEHGKWIDDEEGYKCVLAWQPLPEPYKGGEE